MRMKLSILQPPQSNECVSGMIKTEIQFFFQNSLSLTEDSGISESGDNDNEETILIKLRRLAQDLENKLTPDSHLIREITEVGFTHRVLIYIEAPLHSRRKSPLDRLEV